jgi:hypothetical protein
MSDHADVRPPVEVAVSSSSASAGPPPEFLHYSSMGDLRLVQKDDRGNFRITRLGYTRQPWTHTDSSGTGNSYAIRMDGLNMMRARLAEVLRDGPASAAARGLASKFIEDIWKQIEIAGKPVPYPDIFVNRAGDISFEWLPHITKSNAAASILLSTDGMVAGYFVIDKEGVVLDVILPQGRELDAFLSHVHTLIGR